MVDENVCVCVFTLLQMLADCFTGSCYACTLYLPNRISMTVVCVVVCGNLSTLVTAVLGKMQYSNILCLSMVASFTLHGLTF
jgi:hypothetical protein